MIPTYLERVYPDMILSDIDWETKPKTEPGSRYETTYYPVTDDAGHFELKEKGKIDVYAEIQSHKDSVDINRIISRCAAGDLSALNKHAGFFADVSEVPTSYAAILQRISDAEVVFAELPSEIREQFNFDVNEFIGSFGTEKFDAIFKKKDTAAPSEAAPSESPVIKDGELSE